MRRTILVLCLLWLAGVLLAQGGPGSASPTNPGAYVTTQRFEDYMRAHEREHELIAQAIVEAKLTVNQRLEGMNELRAQINTERSNFATSAGAEALRQRIDRLEQAQASASGASATWAIAMGILVLVVNVAMRFIPFKK